MTEAYWSDADALTPAASIMHDLDRDALVFHVGGREVLALHHSGKVEVQGRVCGCDKELFTTLHTFCTLVARHLSDGSTTK